ncbi:hypothetical protein B0H14DRAFT_2617540 [Mycena olivaceomarginata]|nr:hypothetical protein B0H14DRAFT_2617540 [Mycena olivaceomarginata]
MIDHSKTLFTVFVNVAAARTIALTVTSTTVSDIRHAPGTGLSQGLWRPLRPHETMSNLGVSGLRHFIIPPRLLGGARDTNSLSEENLTTRADGMVVNEHGWEQGALNPGGTSKDASQIDFGSDPGTPPAEGLRATHGKNAWYSAAVAAEKEVHSDDDQPTHKKHKRTNSKGNKKASASDEEESPYSTEDGNDTESDSDAQAEISHEEIAEGLPTKTVEEGTSRLPKASKEPKRWPKKQKTTPVTSSQPLQPDTASSSGKSTETAAQKRNTRNAIWYFFTGPVTDHNFSKEIHVGDKFYRCRHGKPKDVLRMTTAMRGSLNGLLSLCSSLNSR